MVGAVVMVRVTVAGRRRFPCLRSLLLLAAFGFLCLQLHVSNLATHETTSEPANDTVLILSMVPQVLHKFLTSKPRNVSQSLNGTNGNGTSMNGGLPIREILKSIHKYNQEQVVHNEDIFGPIQNDTLIIVIQGSQNKRGIANILI